MRFLAASAVATLLSLSAAAHAADAPAPAPAPSGAAAQPDKPKKICRLETGTGSVMPKRVCRTPEQIEADHEAAGRSRDQHDRGL